MQKYQLVAGAFEFPPRTLLEYYHDPELEKTLERLAREVRIQTGETHTKRARVTESYPFDVYFIDEDGNDVFGDLETFAQVRAACAPPG